MEYRNDETIEIIRMKVVQDLRKQTTVKLSNEQWRDIATKLTPWGSCPANQNKRVEMIACALCPYGHLTDCHYPKSCSQANCSHYQREYPNLVQNAILGEHRK